MIDADLIYVGIDVSKASLDICVGVMGSMSTLGSDGAGHDALCRMLKPLKVGLVVLETEVRQNGSKERVQLDDQ